jgi:hypothetical protein
MVELHPPLYALGAMLGQAALAGPLGNQRNPDCSCFLGNRQRASHGFPVESAQLIFKKTPVFPDNSPAPASRPKRLPSSQVPDITLRGKMRRDSQKQRASRKKSPIPRSLPIARTTRRPKCHPLEGRCIIGSNTSKTLPFPGVLLTEILPPWRSTIFWQRARPIPVPSNTSRECRR